MKRFASFLIATTILLLVSCAQADLVPGTISDFQDGTTQGWAGGTTINVANVGPLGAGDNALQLSNGGSGGNFAMQNTSVGGVIDPAVVSITADIFRPNGESDAEIRLVLFDDNGFSDRWTTTNSVLVVGDGLWHTYTFSILESDLTQVVSAGGTYADLVANLNRIMFRFDPSGPSPGGSSLAGTMLFDNITANTAIPEPAGSAICGLLIGALAFRRRR